MPSSAAITQAGTRLPPQLLLLPAILVVATILLQGAAWTGWLPAANGSTGKTVLALAEMGLLLLLLWNGWRIRDWAASVPRHGKLHVQVANLVFASLALCILGDLVNRNFPQTFYAHDSVIEHSYLVDSVWFFFPGYALFLVAAWKATSPQVPGLLRWPLLVIAAVAAATSFAGLVLPGCSPYVVLMTGGYAVLIALMVPAAVWIAVALGRPAWPVAAGAALATIADALIGHFWLFGRGHYPDIAYLNFVVYFLSQVLVQQLPVVLAQQHAIAADRNPARPSREEELHV